MSNDFSYPDLPSLTSSEMTSAQSIIFQKSPSNGAGWDVEANIASRDSNALLHSLYKFNATEGDTLDIFSISYYDPYVLRIYDEKGNILIANSESNDPSDSQFKIDGVGHGVDFIQDFMATYSGTYYVQASWNQGSIFKFHELIIGADTDTTLDQKADQIFSWAEANYQDLFSSHPQSEEIAGFHARFYYENGTALGEKDGNIFFYDATTEIVALVGTVNDFPI